MKVALVHDHIQEFGGAERVLVSLKKIYPEADVYTSIYNPAGLGIHAEQFKDWNIITSWAQKVPFFKKLYSPLRFLIPRIWESIDLKGYDLVISSSGWFMSKGVITKPETLHVCYLHHPPRSFYYYETAVEWQKYLPFKIYGNIVNHGLRMWDYISSQRPDYFIANSVETQKRIRKFYRRDSTVIYPPVDIPEKAEITTKGSYYITTSRLARAKHIDLLIEAANDMKIPLKIVGTGRDEEYLKSLAKNTVEFLGSVPDEKLKKLYINAKGFLFASVDEEFGIAVVEAMGYGIPVIAYRSGGVPEYVEEGKNGYLFEEFTKDALIEKIKRIEHLSESELLAMKKHARSTSENFSEEKFSKHIKDFINSHMENKHEKNK